MKLLHGLSAVVTVATGVALAWSQNPAAIVSPGKPRQPVDLTKIERKLVKEPLYNGKEQKFCLLVFGREAKTRIWLVLDGDVLYVDRNGNGDLREDGEHVEAFRTGSYLGGDIEDDPEKTRHTNLRVFRESTGHVHIDVKIAGKLKQASRPTFASRRDEAPIVHFNGPVSLRLNTPYDIVSGDKLENLGLGDPSLLLRGNRVYLSGSFGHRVSARALLHDIGQRTFWPKVN
jgi:hypothetical protein